MANKKINLLVMCQDAWWCEDALELLILGYIRYHYNINHIGAVGGLPLLLNEVWDGCPEEIFINAVDIMVEKEMIAEKTIENDVGGKTLVYYPVDRNEEVN